MKGNDIWFISTVIGTAVIASMLTVPSGSAAIQPKPLQYRIVMSKNDSLCHTLVDFYNHHRTAEDSEDNGLIEDQFKNYEKKNGLVFLSNNGIGDTPYSVDIYNNGSKRTVVARDTSINTDFVTEYTQLLIMKPGAEYESGQDNIGSPKIETWVDFSNGGSSKYWSANNHPWEYTLREYPSIDLIIKHQKAGNFSDFDSPFLSQGTFQRIIIYKNNVYILARGVPVLVYKLDPDGELIDICYLSLTKIAK